MFFKYLAQGVRGSPAGGAGCLTAILRISRVEMGSFWDLMTLNTIFRASKLACLGHASSRWMTIRGEGEEKRGKTGRDSARIN